MKLRQTLIALSLFALNGAFAQSEQGQLTSKLQALEASKDNKWLITPMRPNYIMPVTYWFDQNYAPLDAVDPDNDTELDHVEVKFQISFMAPVAEDAIFGNGDLYVAYTQVSFWQPYNSDESAPFRETNYEPETFVLFQNDWEIFGWKNTANSIGYVHQSNGRGTEEYSRSWDRIAANFLFEKGNWVMNIKPWWRFSDDDENPHIDHYMGYGHLQLAYKQGDHVFSTLLRNNLNIDRNKGAAEVNWTFPLMGRFRGIAHYFYGYGENLLDYNYESQRVGLGVMLSDFL